MYVHPTKDQPKQKWRADLQDNIEQVYCIISFYIKNLLNKYAGWIEL
jgi:hypothetical protein